MTPWGAWYFAHRGYVLAVLLAALSVIRFISSAPLYFAWLGMVLIGILLRLWAGAHIGPHSSGIVLTFGPRAKTGPYKILRHPLYLSNLLVSAGLIGFANCLTPFWGLSFWMITVAHHAVLIGMENSLPPTDTMPALPANWKTAWIRQRGNIGYTFATVGLLYLPSFLRDYL